MSSVTSSPFRAIWRAIKTCFLVIIALGLLLVSVEKCALMFAPSNRLGHFLKYSTLVGSSGNWDVAAYEQVTVDPQSHDCEWLTAPLGGKHCHYDPVLNSIRTRVTETGVSLVSYDEGKTSMVNALHETPSIHVSWKKIEE